MADEPVLIRDQRDAVLVLRLNRPEARNAFNPELMGELGSALAQAESDPDVRAVVLTGTGDRSFCAGMDLRAFSEGGGGGPAGSEEGQATFTRFMGGGGIDIPIVGAAQATAVAGGFELLLNCDLAVVSEDAKLGLPEVKRALFAAGGGVYLSNRIPLALALELTLTGEYISAPRAYEIGLVNRVVPAAEVVDAAVELATTVARNGPLALRATKEVVRLASTDMVAARERFAEWMPKVFGSQDAQEGALAFVEKRDPVWKGE
jgi:enoyl-CoA hydratase/carnithine racemase